MLYFDGFGVSNSIIVNKASGSNKFIVSCYGYFLD